MNCYFNCLTKNEIPQAIAFSPDTCDFKITKFHLLSWNHLKTDGPWNVNFSASIY